MHGRCSDPNSRHRTWYDAFRLPFHATTGEFVTSVSNLPSQGANSSVPSSTLESGVQVPVGEKMDILSQRKRTRAELASNSDIVAKASLKSTDSTNATNAKKQSSAETPSSTRPSEPSLPPIKRKSNRAKKPPLQSSLSEIASSLATYQTLLVDATEKLLRCPDCSRTFSWHFQLQQHAKTHTGERPFVCKECPLAYKRRDHLKRHERVHTGERPFECEDCDKKYRRKAQLTRHSRIHTGERPYPCPDCEKKFRRRTQLTRHLKVHNRKTSKNLKHDVSGDPVSEQLPPSPLV